VTFPLLSSTYTDPELVTSANLYTRVLAVINTLGGFLYGEAEGTTSNTVILSSGSTNFLVPTAAVTFTLSQQRRVRISGGCRIDASGGVASVGQAQVAYVAGNTATLSGATLLGQSGGQETSIAANGIGLVRVEHSVLLAAAQYTAFVAAQRATGGSATDVARAGYVAVYDAGSS